MADVVLWLGGSPWGNSRTLLLQLQPSVEIPGLPGRWREIAERYDYGAAKYLCPNCGEFGRPWAGWFSCDSCSCKAVVETGQAFVAETPPPKE